MSGVWTEKSVPMTDHECAVEALEEIGATILASNENQVRIRINGNEWALKKTHGRYSLRYNRRTAGTNLSWIDNIGQVYEQSVVRKLRRLRTAEENAQLGSELEVVRAEREAFEAQRQGLIEQRRQEILEKARTLGYRVKETEQNGQIRMVLIRTG